MLGRTAGGLFWMFRYLERAENTARLIETGWRIALTRSEGAETEWESVVNTAGLRDAFLSKHDSFDSQAVINFLLRDRDTPSSVLAALGAARSNARMVRTALSSEVWEATNECWMAIKDALARPVTTRTLPEILAAIRYRTAVVRGALHGTMLRNDIFAFARLGTFIERADNTARILDVKYYVLLPSAAFVGSSMDNTQWETILRSVSAERAFRWLHAGESSPLAIADFLILDQRMPRSLAFCCTEIRDNLAMLEREYGERSPCMDLADHLCNTFMSRNIDEIFEDGLHEFLSDTLTAAARLAGQIEQDFRFNG
ncbi:MAG: alpha-E domain-containing protein [Rhodobacteraceae bacterium]|nr:alpha-E domain-containing protein [Paracoccaceae bacterium]